MANFLGKGLGKGNDPTAEHLKEEVFGKEEQNPAGVTRSDPPGTPALTGDTLLPAQVADLYYRTNFPKRALTERKRHAAAWRLSPTMSC